MIGELENTSESVLGVSKLALASLSLIQVFYFFFFFFFKSIIIILPILNQAQARSNTTGGEIVGSTTQRQIRLSQCQKIILENENQGLAIVKTKVERYLMDNGFGWHTRRDYMRVLNLI